MTIDLIMSKPLYIFIAGMVVCAMIYHVFENQIKRYGGMSGIIERVMTNDVVAYATLALAIGFIFIIPTVILIENNILYLFAIILIMVWSNYLSYRLLYIDYKKEQ